jgi:hypothetical protein
MNLALVRTLVGIAAAVVAYLLVQTEVPLDPIAKVALGAISVALAVLSPSAIAARLPSR